MASPRYILDTGPLVAFANGADAHHAWAREVLNALGERFPRAKIITTDIRDFSIYRRPRGQPLSLIHP